MSEKEDFPSPKAGKPGKSNYTPEQNSISKPSNTLVPKELEWTVFPFCICAMFMAADLFWNFYLSSQSPFSPKPETGNTQVYFTSINKIPMTVYVTRFEHAISMVLAWGTLLVPGMLLTWNYFAKRKRK